MTEAERQLIERKARIVRFVESNPGLSAARVAKQLSDDGGERITKSGVQRALVSWRRGEAKLMSALGGAAEQERMGVTVELDDNAGVGVVTTRSLNITTLEGALEAARVDTDVWEVERNVINFWETTMGATRTQGDRTYTNCQVKVWLRRRLPKPVTDYLAESLARFDAKNPPRLPPVSRAKLPADFRYMVEWDVFDPHFGMLAWAQETGNDWDTGIAYDVVVRATRDAIARVRGLPVERVLIPFGNDWLHLDSILTETPKGKNTLEVDSRFPKIVERAERAALDMVRLWREVAPVRVIWIPGNHDPSSSYMLARILQAHFRADGEVDVDCSPDPHKVVTFGPAAIAFTHGQIAKRRDLSAVMMSRFRAEFGRCKHFEVHAGHIHKASATRLSACDTLDGGIIHRTIASLAGTDYWHYTNGFHPRPQAAEMFLWHSRDGLHAHHTIPARWQE